MARFTVELSPRALEDVQALSPEVAARIVRTLRQLEGSPFPRGETVKHLHGFGTPTYRLRIGDYRAVYRIYGTVVGILRIIKRSELERALRDLV